MMMMTRNAIGVDKEGKEEANGRSGGGGKSEITATAEDGEILKDRWSFGGYLNEEKNEKTHNTVEFWMNSGNIGEKKCIRVDKDRLFVLGMKTYPEIVDLTQMTKPVSQILEQILTSSRLGFSTQLPMLQAAELCHVATELKFVNLLKIMERDLIKQKTSETMEQSVDSLCISMRFGWKEGMDKLIDEIIFDGFLNEHLLMYCKNQKALDMIFKRKADLEGPDLQDRPGHDPWAQDLWAQDPWGQGPSSTMGPPSQQQVALPHVQQNAQMHKVIMNAAKEKFRGIMNRPINSFKNGIAWISAQNLRRRRQPARGNGIGEWPEFQHF